MSSVFAVKQRKSGREDLLLDKVLAAAAILVASALAIYVLARFLLVPLTAIKHIDVESDVSLSEDQILAQAGISGTESYYSLSADRIEQKLEANPLVRKALVVKVFPDTLRVSLYRREPVALVLATAGDRNIPVLVDREGVVFKIGITGAEVDLPVISGLTLGETALGAQVPKSYRDVVGDLAALKTKSPALYRVVSEVRVVPLASETGAYELLLYFLTTTVRVKARGPVDETLLKYSLMVIDLLSNRGVLRDIEEVDFRGEDVVYRMKGG
jgi:cell division protein FtsQ